MSERERHSIYAAVAAILHLGNIQFEDNPDDVRGGCRLASQSTAALNIASSLIGVDPEELQHAMLSRVMQPSKGGIKGTVIMVPLKVTIILFTWLNGKKYSSWYRNIMFISIYFDWRLNNSRPMINNFSTFRKLKVGRKLILFYSFFLTTFLSKICYLVFCFEL